MTEVQWIFLYRRAGIKIVYARLPILAGTGTEPARHDREDATRDDDDAAQAGTAARDPPPPRSLRQTVPVKLALSTERFKLRARAELRDWVVFVKAPVFFSCLSISLLYLTVLSCVSPLFPP